MSKTQSADVWVRVPSYVDNANLKELLLVVKTKL